MKRRNCCWSVGNPVGKNTGKSSVVWASGSNFLTSIGTSNAPFVLIVSHKTPLKFLQIQRRKGKQITRVKKKNPCVWISVTEKIMFHPLKHMYSPSARCQAQMYMLAFWLHVIKASLTYNNKQSSTLHRSEALRLCLSLIYRFLSGSLVVRFPIGERLMISKKMFLRLWAEL